MTVRELINMLMNLDLDKPVFITEIDKDAETKCIGYVGMSPIIISEKQIIDVNIHGIYNTDFNCITIQ